LLGTQVFCNGTDKRMGTHESAGQMFKHPEFLEWDTSYIPDGSIERVELEIKVSSGMSFGNTEVQVKSMTASASSYMCGPGFVQQHLVDDRVRDEQGVERAAG
jgi:hypothetical protein